MKRRPVVILLVCILVTTLIGVSQAQDVMIAEPYSAGLTVPMEVLMGLIGKYAAMVEEYQILSAYGGAPESAAEFRLAAKIIMDDGADDSDVEPILTGLSGMVFWVKASVFNRSTTHFSMRLSGSLGDVEILSTPAETYVILRDEAVFSSLSSGADIMDVGDLGGLLSTDEGLPEDIAAVGADSLAELSQEEFTAFMLELLDDTVPEYGGVEPTPRGMAHIVKLTFADTGEIVTLWVLDGTWDLCKIGIDTPDDDISAVLIIEELELVAPALPDSAFVTDVAGLVELPYDELLLFLGMKVLVVSLTGTPVAADLALSLAEVPQGKQVIVKSNGLDGEELESDLVALIECRSSSGSWIPLSAVYVGTAPSGHWEAAFVPSFSELPGSYDFRVTYTDSFGMISDPLELTAALNVIAVPPQVVSMSPDDRDEGVPLASQVTVAFTQEMDRVSAESAFSLTDALGQAVSGTFEWVDNALVFKPDESLMYGRRYSVKILGAAASLSAVTLGDEVVWTFYTERAPLPEITEASPENTQRGVSVSARLSVAFTEVMDQASVENAFSLVSVAQTVSGSFLWADNTLTFVPTQDLEYNTTYRVKLAGSASSAIGAGIDSNGNGISEGSPKDNLSWWFSTEAFPVFAVKPVSQSALAGDFITVDIIAEAVSQLGSFALTVDFDPAVLSLLKVERVSFVTWRPRPKIITDVDIWRDTIIDDEQGLIVIAADSTRSGGISGTGAVATLTFRASGVGESPVTLKDVSAANALGEDISPGLRYGSVQVMEFSPWDANQDGVVNILDFIVIQNGRGADADVNGDGVVDILDMVAAAGGALVSPALTPVVSQLYGNYPNPFNPETWIPYQLAKDATVSIRVYSAAGRLVRTLDLGYKHAGRYTTKAAAVYWDGTNEAGEQVASGIYYYSITAGDFSAVGKMAVLD